MINLNVVNKVINSVVLGNDDALHFVFNDGTKMRLWDDESLCCERRYMTVDDDLSLFSNSKLISIKLHDATSIDHEGEDSHDIQFLEVMTSIGSFTVVTHNEHNSYYGGFCVRMDYE